MSDGMRLFPDTIEEYLNKYTVKRENTEMIPVFRVQQAFAHYLDRNTEACELCRNPASLNYKMYSLIDFNENITFKQIEGGRYCPKCGRKL